VRAVRKARYGCQRPAVVLAEGIDGVDRERNILPQVPHGLPACHRIPSRIAAGLARVGKSGAAFVSAPDVMNQETMRDAEAADPTGRRCGGTGAPGPRSMRDAVARRPAYAGRRTAGSSASGCSRPARFGCIRRCRDDRLHRVSQDWESTSCMCCRISQRCGVGARCLRVAQGAFVRLQLWTFQRNMPARRFYEARGFTLVDQTVGAGNAGKSRTRFNRWTRTVPL